MYYSKYPEKKHHFNTNMNQHCFQHFVFLSSNYLIRMISEGSCETDDWSNDAENSAFPSRE